LEKIGEVVEATTAEFTAQSYELHQAPPFGSLVKAWEGEMAIYGVVCHSSTASIEPGRRPIARGREAEREEDIFAQNPQLARLLRTDFRALVLGHESQGQVYHFLPPRPPRIHAFVYPCSPEEVVGFTESLDFLPLILAAGNAVPREELVGGGGGGGGGAGARSSSGGERAFLVRAGKELALLLAGEPARLNLILRRIRP
jgi:hypothetical protein